ncbi:hypothetical protein OAA53_03445 [Salibacteraceae bacterium]|nr:hypothetical protein [Salibacteraceae bacterium]
MKLVVNTILLSFFYFMIFAMGAAAFTVTGPDQPPVGLWIGMVVFFIVCCIPLWIWRSRLNRNQEKVSIIRSPILWWKSQPVYSNFLLILVPGLFILVFIIVGLDTTGLLNWILQFLLIAYVMASVLYLSWDLLVKKKLHKNPVFWVVIGVIALMIYLPSIIGTGTGSSNNYAACSQYGSKSTVEERIRSLEYKKVSIRLNSEGDCRYQWLVQVISDNGNDGWCEMTTDGNSGSVEIVSATCN